MIFRPGGVLVAKRRRVELQSARPEQGVLVDDTEVLETRAEEEDVRAAGGKST